MLQRKQDFALQGECLEVFSVCFSYLAIIAALRLRVLRVGSILLLPHNLRNPSSWESLCYWGSK